MTEIQLEARKELRERAFQALMVLEYQPDVLAACRFAYLYDKEEAEKQEVDLPAFLLNLVTGVYQSKTELDQKIAPYLKVGWTFERLTMVEKNLLRLGVFEIVEFNTPPRVAINEAIELSKTFSDKGATKFINGVLSHFVPEE